MAETHSIHMRTEKEMFELILETAREDERIRAVILNGSRANPNAPRDFFQDFDVVYLVSDVAPFKNNYDWIRRFGELMILQEPEEMGDPPPKQDGGVVFLMQFMDGNRIDLGIYPVSMAAEMVTDSLSVLLLDKDSIVPAFPPADESGYIPKPPTCKAFADCCNEFWWVSAYVAKGLWREQILYAHHMLDQYTREQLMKMLAWYIGIRTGFTVNPGKFGKYYQRCLEPGLWERVLKTFADSDTSHTWEALFAMCDLFRVVAVRVGQHFGYDYPHRDDRRVSAHLRHVRSLPKDARVMY